MDCGGVDTRWWNLSLGVVAAAGVGCGPTVVLYGDTEADTSDDTGPMPDTGIDPPTADGPQCSDAVPCPDNQVCVNGICMDGYADDYVDYSDYADYVDYSDYADEFYCYQYGPKGECCSYYECPEICGDDEDCGVGQLCLPYKYASFCIAIPELEECPIEPAVMMLPLMPGPSPFISLAFVDADGGPQDDLLVSYDADGVELVSASGSVGLTIGPDVMLDGASGDFNGDMIQDIVVAFDNGSLTIFNGDGMGGFAEAQTLVGFGEFPEITPLQFNSDGDLDLAVRNTGAAALIMVNLGDGTLAQGVDLDTEGGIAYSIAAGGNLLGDELDDVIVSRPLRDEWFEGGDVMGTVQPTTTGELGPALGERLVDLVDFNGDGLATPMGLTEMPTWTLLEGANLPTRFQIPYPARRVGLGDHDGDGMPDAALVGGNRLLWLTGFGDPLLDEESCWSTILLDYEPISASVGDWNGDGLADVAITDGVDLTIVLTL